EISVTGVKSLDGISLSGKTVTVAAASLNQSTVTISDGYTLKLAGDVTTPVSTAAHWEISNGTANYIGEAFSAGYALENNQIVYKAATTGETEISVTGVKSLDGISLSGKTVTVAAASLNQSTVTITDGYTLKLASNVTTPESTAAHWEFASGTANYIGEAFSAGYALENNQIVYKAATGGDIEITIRGLRNDASGEGIKLNGKEITLTADTLGQDTVTVSEGYTLALAEDVEVSEKVAAHFEISGNTAIYADEETTSGYVLISDGTVVQYVSESGGETLFTISGLRSGASTDGISINGTEITLAASVLGEDTVSISAGYSLKLADDVPISSTTPAHWNISNGTAEYLDDYTSAGYVMNADGTISYIYESGGDILTTVIGLSSSATAADISLNGTVITISAAALGTEAVISYNGYTLALADDVTASENTPAHWNISNGTAGYLSDYTSAGYYLSFSDVIEYRAESGGEILTTVTGLSASATDADISLSGREVVLTAAALNQENVTVSNGYTIRITEDVPRPETTSEHWEFDGSTANYITEYTGAGYYFVSGSELGYSAATGGETLVTVTGLSSSVTGYDIYLNGTEVILYAAALNQENVTVSEGYTLALADDVPRPEASDMHWEISGSTATYRSGTVSAGYVLNTDGTVTYNAETGGAVLATVTGVSSLDGISISGTVITISADSLRQTTVTVSDGYTLALAEDVTTSTTTPAYWEVADGTANYISEYKTAGYILADNQISYQAETGGDTLITITGLSSGATTSDISMSGTEITISAAALNQTAVTVTEATRSSSPATSLRRKLPPHTGKFPAAPPVISLHTPAPVTSKIQTAQSATPKKPAAIR
ncbi:MAG: hypothetical protein J5809_02245, partial [Selenomonadaceae bacterium]|nr:hypothetical protein [Selenomonadaceae bacterium]